MRPRRHTLAIAALAIGLAACGGGDGGEDATATQPAVTVAGEATFVGNDAIAWEQDTVAAELVDGGLEVTIVCDGVVPHNLVIEGVEDEGPVVDCAGNDEATATVVLEPGTDDFWCSIPGHREAGMEGVLTVS